MQDNSASSETGHGQCSNHNQRMPVPSTVEPKQLISYLYFTVEHALLIV